ncbi:trafficking protein particle complex subunit 10-like [Tropilaelaps mercedesae]|uniref:Trafficking protein particle complex subunit 10-like n=1 Tax=Tropilaelaps mercedesae TaxID=418985 RepID=A0A1V9X9B3_9ACAR|nr:trafficking protein particle complex subunit 10-like [Tropilaelaps mercedesae]
MLMSSDMGNCTLFEELRDSICSAVGVEATEWRRSLGRNRMVHIDANWVEFDKDRLSANRETLLNRQYLHTFWTDCSDSDEYKNTVKQEILLWMQELKAKSQWDWLIVVVEDNARKTPAKTTSKLLKSTVWDRIRNDFPSKNIDRVCTFIRPSRGELGNRNASLDTFLGQFRTALLHGLNREIGYYEDKLREKREARNSVGWSFIDFYFMQEQLAFVFETMTLYEDALVQYDELDALLTQFVINAAQGEAPPWLQTLTNCRSSWKALSMKSHNTSLTTTTDSRQHKQCQHQQQSTNTLFGDGKGSLLDLRNLLFLRICNILILLCRPWEMARRALPYIQNAQVELKSLCVELNCPGAVDAWALAGFLETLFVSERYNDSSQVESYSLHTAQLWAHARLKMKSLGILCGLMPRDLPTSEQIHRVVNILAGLGDDPRAGESELSPCRRISEALSSKESFMRHYKDVCEIAMGTFKHVGRLRSARLIGKDLAEFYLDKDEPQMAVQFLQDLLKMYLTERWVSLAVLTQKQLLQCYQLLSYDLLYLHTVLMLATNRSLDQRERRHFFDDVLATKDRLSKSMKSNKNLMFAFAGILSLDELQIVSDSSILTLNSDIRLRLTVTSNLLAEVKMRKVIVPCEKLEEVSQIRGSPRKGSVILPPGGKRPLPKISVQQVTQTNSIGLVCSNQHQVLSRQDSSNLGSPSSQDLVRVKSDTQFVAKDVYLAPGPNVIELAFRTTQWGSHEMRQLVMEWDHLGFVENLENSIHRTRVDIIEEKCRLSFELPSEELLAGVSQSVKLLVNAGSRAVSAGSIVALSSLSPGLHFDESSVVIPEEIAAFESRSFSISLKSDFCDQWTPNGVIHEITACARWEDAQEGQNELSDIQAVQEKVKLRFTPPFIVTHKLHTCDTSKFIQVEVIGHSSQFFSVRNPRLDCPSGLTAHILEKVDVFRVNSSYPTAFVWQLESTKEFDKPLQLKFALDFYWDAGNQTGVYSALFKIDALKTLCSVHVTVEPESQGHCKVDALCKLNIRVQRMHSGIKMENRSFDKDPMQLRMEISADPGLWALQGRNSDTFTLDQEYTSSVEMKPLVRGYLPIPQVQLMIYHPPCKVEHDKDLAKEKLEPFLFGQVYSWSRAAQTQVPTAAHPDGK